MSHDIYFSPQDSGTRFDPAAFAAYVEQHPALTERTSSNLGRKLDIEEREVEYRNSNTEVEFCYEQFRAPTDSGRWPLVLTIDYARPHVFGLEAAIELARFTERFALRIIDPQVVPPDPRPFDRNRFLESYEQGNRAAHRVRLEQNDPDRGPLRTLPQATLERSWRWNLEVELDSKPFTPCVSYAEVFGLPQVVVVWPDGPEFILPEVDLLLTWRAKGRKPSVTPMAELRDRLKNEPRVHRTLDTLDAWHVRVEPELARAIDKLPRYDGPVTPLELGEILNREWV